MLGTPQAKDQPIHARPDQPGWGLSGHGAGEPTRKAIEERADILAFLVRTFGLALPPR